MSMAGVNASSTLTALAASRDRRYVVVDKRCNAGVSGRSVKSTGRRPQIVNPRLVAPSNSFSSTESRQASVHHRNVAAVADAVTMLQQLRDRALAGVTAVSKVKSSIVSTFCNTT